MKHIVTYLEYTKANYDFEYPDNFEEPEDGRFRGRVKKEFVEADDTKSAHTKFLEAHKVDGWKLYSWNAIIKDGIVRCGFSVATAADPRHCYGYEIKKVITEVAPNAQRWWIDA